MRSLFRSSTTSRGYAVPIIATALIIFLAACDHKSVETAPVIPIVPHHATVGITWTFVRGDRGWTLDTLLQDSLQHQIKVDDMRFYISGIKALDDSDIVIGNYTDKHFLLVAGQTNDFALGTIYASHIHQYTMQLGVDSATNHADFATATAPLNDTMMRWAGTSPDGYKFLRIRGRYDGNNDGLVDASDQSFAFDCGTDAALTPTAIYLHHDFTEGETYTAHGYVNMGLLFDHIDILNTPQGQGVDPVCLRLIRNVGDVIYGEAHH